MDVLTEVIQGILAIMLVGFLGGIALVEVLNNKPFSEPITLAALSGAAIGFLFAQRNQRRQQEVISDMAKQIINGANSKANGK